MHRRKPKNIAEILQTEGHKKTRLAHASEIAEDYVEVIAELIEKRGEARLIEVARIFGVSHVTALRKIKRLAQEGLVETEPYRSIFLSAKGKSLASRAKYRHTVVENFLKALGVSSENATRDAEGIEHHVSKETLRAFENYLVKVNGKAYE